MIYKGQTMSKNTFKKERFLWIFIVLIILMMQLFPFCTSRGNSNNNSDENVYFDLLREAMQYIRLYYVDEEKIDYKNLMHGAVKGMLESLGDDHTSFLSEEDFADLKSSISGNFGGLGIYITVKDGYPTVISPIEGTPADKMGIEAGDIIVEIEGKPTKGMNIDEVVKKLKGKEGTKVTFKVARESALELIPFTITRAKINVPSVKSGFIKKGLAYIKITSFGEKTTKSLKKAISKLKEKGMEKVIVDLRNNPGGLLSAAEKISDMFINEGKIVYTRGRHPRDDEDFYASAERTLIDYNVPVVVLVNEGSASASEILSGAIQDTNRGLIVGAKTFGKGSVQNIIELKRSGEDVAMRLTIQKYFTPKGRSIHGKGIEPDVLINFPKKTFEERYMEKKLYDGKYIAKFLKKYPNYTDDNISELMSQLEKDQIQIKRRMVEKYLRDQNRKIGKQLYDLEYDIQLKKAVEVIESSDMRNKTVKVYK